MLENYAVLAIWLLIALAFPAATLVLAGFLRPSQPNSIKYENYECGIESEGGSWVKYNFKFYLYALVFAVFDTAALFLFPWATVFRQFGLYALATMGVFLGILLVGFVYAWQKRALEWS